MDEFHNVSGQQGSPEIRNVEAILAAHQAQGLGGGFAAKYSGQQRGGQEGGRGGGI